MPVEAWTKIGYSSAGGVVVVVVVRSLTHAGLEGRANSASTVQELSDAANAYHRLSQLLLILAAAAALLAVVALVRIRAERPVPQPTPGVSGSWDVVTSWWVGASLVSVVYAAWRTWRATWSGQPSMNVLLAGNAAPSPDAVAAVTAAADRPVPHAGPVGLIIVCALAASYVVVLRRARLSMS